MNKPCSFISCFGPQELCSEISDDKAECWPTRMNVFWWRQIQLQDTRPAIYCITAVLTVNLLWTHKHSLLVQDPAVYRLFGMIFPMYFLYWVTSSNPVVLLVKNSVTQSTTLVPTVYNLCFVPCDKLRSQLPAIIFYLAGYFIRRGVLHIDHIWNLQDMGGVSQLVCSYDPEKMQVL